MSYRAKDIVSAKRWRQFMEDGGASKRDVVHVEMSQQGSIQVYVIHYGQKASATFKQTHVIEFIPLFNCLPSKTRVSRILYRLTFDQEVACPMGLNEFGPFQCKH